MGFENLHNSSEGARKLRQKVTAFAQNINEPGDTPMPVRSLSNALSGISLRKVAPSIAPIWAGKSEEAVVKTNDSGFQMYSLADENDVFIMSVSDEERFNGISSQLRKIEPDQFSVTHEFVPVKEDELNSDELECEFVAEYAADMFLNARAPVLETVEEEVIFSNVVNEVTVATIDKEEFLVTEEVVFAEPAFIDISALMVPVAVSEEEVIFSDVYDEVAIETVATEEIVYAEPSFIDISALMIPVASAPAFVDITALMEPVAEAHSEEVVSKPAFIDISALFTPVAEASVEAIEGSFQDIVSASVDSAVVGVSLITAIPQLAMTSSVASVPVVAIPVFEEEVVEESYDSDDYDFLPPSSAPIRRAPGVRFNNEVMTAAVTVAAVESSCVPALVLEEVESEETFLPEPTFIEVEDEVSGVMELTIPQLSEDLEMLEVDTPEVNVSYDDGLEALCMLPEVQDCAPESTVVSFTFAGVESNNLGTSVNFSFGF